MQSPQDSINDLRQELGQTLAEVSLVMAFVVVLCVVSVTMIGGIVLGYFTDFLAGFG
jgi:Flp pilus assembly pilin Flp